MLRILKGLAVMKKPKLFLLIFLVFLPILLLVILLSIIIFPLPKHTVIDDPDKYGKFDSYVKEKLDDTFGVSLPDKLHNDWNVNGYSYEYQESVFEFPCFYIGLDITPNNTDFEAEFERISAINGAEILKSEKASYIVLRGMDDLGEYCDKSSWLDGCYFYFEIVEFDRSDNSIRYFLANISDVWSFGSDYMGILNSVNALTGGKYEPETVH